MKPQLTSIFGAALLLLFGCGKMNDSDISRNKNVVLRLHSRLFSEGDIDICDEIYAPDFVCHFLIGPDWHGPEGVKEHVTALRDAFPDWHEVVEDIIAESDMVVTRFTSYGTQTGEFQGIAATGRHVKVREVAIFRFSNGKIAEQWGFPDIAGMRAQLLGGTNSDSTTRPPHISQVQTGALKASGTFAPSGAPSSPPVRVDAGESCIVDLRQPYKFSGTLKGTADIDYRILVHGPCGSPIGTFDEDWIAHGTFAGIIHELDRQATFTYTAHVKAGGTVEGKIILGQAVTGELLVSGNFGDGNLSYSGWVWLQDDGSD